METIKDRLRKIKILAERGIEGEARAAQFQLEKLLAKYNLKIEDIFEETLKDRMFKVQKTDMQLFIQVVSKNIGDRYKECYTYKGKPLEHWLNITDNEYVDIVQQLSFYKKQLEKERKKAIEKIQTAFFYKHDLFNKDSEPVAREDSVMSLSEFLSIMSLAGDLEDTFYHKQIDKTIGNGA